MPLPAAAPTHIRCEAAASTLNKVNRDQTRKTRAGTTPYFFLADELYFLRGMKSRKPCLKIQSLA